MFNEHAVRLLQLTKHEVRILKALEKNSYNISELAAITRFPRTTLYTALASLEDRGFTSSRLFGKAKVISLVSNVGDAFALAQPVRDVYTVNGFSIISGKENMFQVWKKIFSQKNERVLYLQSTEALLELSKKFSPAEIAPVNKMIKENKILMEVLTRADGWPVYMKAVAGMIGSAKILHDLLGRMQDMTVVDDRFLKMPTDLIIRRKTAWIMNWKNETCVEIQNEEMVGLLRELFVLAKGYGRRVGFDNSLS